MENFIKQWFLNRGYKKDKPMHFWRLGVYPAVFTFIICFWHFYKDSDSRLVYTELSVFCIGLVIGFGKEIFDWFQGKYWPTKIKGKVFDIVDAFATLAGNLFVIIVTALVVWITMFFFIIK